MKEVILKTDYLSKKITFFEGMPKAFHIITKRKIQLR